MFFVQFLFRYLVSQEVYYKLYGAIGINKTSLLDYDEIQNILLDTVEFDFSPQFLNYFGKDFTQDLKRNRCLFKENKDKYF